MKLFAGVLILLMISNVGLGDDVTNLVKFDLIKYSQILKSSAETVTFTAFGQLLYSSNDAQLTIFQDLPSLDVDHSQPPIAAIVISLLPVSGQSQKFQITNVKVSKSDWTTDVVFQTGGILDFARLIGPDPSQGQGVVGFRYMAPDNSTRFISSAIEANMPNFCTKTMNKIW